MKHARKMAQGIASLGRGEDKMLVHMTPKEVESLQTLAELHGGSLTINPKTGLHEASFLKSLLPMLAGGIATIFTGGAAAPILAGAATGALTREKGVNPWMAALTGGLGGWGGAGIANALGAAGSAATSTAANAAGNQATSSLLNGGTQAAAQQAVANSVANPVLTGAVPNLAGGAANAANVGAGIKSLAANPSKIGSTLAPVGKYRLMAAGAPLVSDSMATPEYAMPEKPDTWYENYRYSPGVNQSGVSGQLPFAGQRYEYLGRSRSPIRAAGGGLMPGMGDGLSDSIPAMIDGQQPARLAANEFVIPADVVADIGNGSSDAGAKRLYAMMDRVRMMRHGTRQQPPAIDPNEVMPA